MYERFYGFEERPFTLLPDPDFLFLSDKHRTALDLLEMAIFNSSGFCVISGDIGAGKTTLIRELLNRLDESINVGLVSNTHPSFGELMQWVMAAYGLPVGVSDKLELHKRFIDYSIEVYAGNRHTLLIIDEAQNLSMQALEELRMLSNVNSDKDLVLQVILVGQQQLRDKLSDPQLEQFAQRIALDYHLETLTEEETRRYIQHRLQHAGGKPDLFSDSACLVVYRVTHGIPRLINRVCDLSLVYGYSEESPQISAEIVEHVAEDQRMGRLFGDQEQIATADFQRVKLKAVGGQPAVPVEPVSAAAREDAAEIQPQTPAGGEKAIEPQRSVDHQRVADRPERRNDAAISANTASVAETSVPATPKPAAARTAKTENCEPVHTTDAVTGLTSEVPEEATEPRMTEEVNTPMNNNKSAAGTTAPDPAQPTQTIVDAMSSILLPGRQSAAGRAEDVQAVPPPASADQLHSLVVDAEKRQRDKSERGALWLLVGVVAMVAGTGWMARDIWFNPVADEPQLAVRSAPAPIKREPLAAAGKPVAESETPLVGKEGGQALVVEAPQPVVDSEALLADQDVLVAEPQSAAVAEPEPLVNTGESSQPLTADAVQAAPQAAIEPTAAAEPAEPLELQDDGPLAEAEPVRATVDSAAQDAELQREAERLARLQAEAERLEKERKAAELKLAKQRAARQALERRTRLEQERIRAAEKTVAKVAVDRARVEKQLNEATKQKLLVKPSAVETAQQPVAKAEPKPAATAGVAVFEPGKVDNDSASTPVVKAEVAAQENKDVRFSNNPCNGPTARFMSTCR